MTGSIIIFVLFYILLITEKVDKSILAVFFAFAAIALRLISFENAIHAIDLNVIFLLIGMMTSVNILADTGFFEWIAIFVAKKMKGSGFGIFAMLLAITIIFSALLDNVTTVILIAPMTILITQILELPTVPFLIFEAMASNIGGTATLIGDPPNIIIGSRVGLTFNDFIVHASPLILVASVVFILLAAFMIRKKLHIPRNIKVRVLEALPENAIRDHRRLRISLMIFALIFAGFALHSVIGIEPGIIALGGMALMMLFARSESDHLLKSVEWDTILFFVGLFIIIGAMEHNGVLDLLAGLLVKISAGNMFLATMIILWGSAAFSSILDNIPFVITMAPLVQKLAVSFGATGTGPHPLFWALAIGACLGGNGTLIGASANVIIAKIGKNNGNPISFGRFSKLSLPLTVLILVIASVYLWLRYLL
ncbi:MAG: ArsB/NhaD family transporter [Spirochaetales bacterium]|nr:ArsB/NhaD family transporter [Spirochaetales bacterium]